MGEPVRLLARGRKRSRGAVGVRHEFLVVPSVICAAQAALVIAEGAADTVAIEHQHGCSQLGGDAHLTEQVLTGLGAHPNVAGTLVVSLGCETVQGLLLHRSILERGQRAEFVGIQQSGGTGAAIRAGREALHRLREAAGADPEVTMEWADLRVGIEAAWLGVPQAQGRVFIDAIDRLLLAGATVIQAVPGERAQGDSLMAYPPRPARELGARGAAALHYAEAPGGKGLFLMGSPESRIGQKTGLAAAGAHVILSPFVDGLPAGCPVAPVVHIGLAPYARPFAGDVEVVLDERPPSAASGAVLEAIAGACREGTALEALGDFEMAIHRIAPTM